MSLRHPIGCDPYEKLRPPPPTASEDLCVCRDEPPIKFMSALGYNPLHCMRCNGEVLPEVLRLPEALAEAIASWRSVYDALDRLWLASATYEIWARSELESIASSVNAEGRAVQAQVNRLRRCYYWWFQDQSIDGYAPPSRCPSCQQQLAPFPETDQQVCERCSIVTVGTGRFQLPPE